MLLYSSCLVKEELGTFLLAVQSFAPLKSFILSYFIHSDFERCVIWLPVLSENLTLPILSDGPSGCRITVYTVQFNLCHFLRTQHVEAFTDKYWKQSDPQVLKTEWLSFVIRRCWTTLAYIFYPDTSSCFPWNGVRFTCETFLCQWAYSKSVSLYPTFRPFAFRRCIIHFEKNVSGAGLTLAFFSGIVLMRLNLLKMLYLLRFFLLCF